MKQQRYRKLSPGRDRPPYPADQFRLWTDSKLLEVVRETNVGFFARPPVEELAKRFEELIRGRP